jgi:hypothetical protein
MDFVEDVAVRGVQRISASSRFSRYRGGRESNRSTDVARMAAFAAEESRERSSIRACCCLCVLWEILLLPHVRHR